MSNNNERSKSNFLAILLGLISIALLCSVFGYFALNRLIARDGGYYLMAAKLVAEGRELYRDFFYPQMPLFPHVYGAWGYFVGFTWIKARLLSALFAVLLGLLLYLNLNRRYNPITAFLGIIIFCCCNLAFSYYTTLTTYPLATLLLFGAYTCLTFESHLVLTILSGLLLGFAVETRLPLAAMVPVFFLIVCFKNRKHFFSHCISFGVALTVALLPAITMFIIDKDIFWYNNLGYHLSRSAETSEQTLLNRLYLLRVLFGLKSANRYTADQIPVLVWCTVVFPFIWLLFRKWHKDLKFEPAVLISVAIIIVYLMPKPAYLQYFTTLVPFVVVGTIASFSILFKYFNKFGKVILCFGILGLSTIYFNYNKLMTDVVNYTKTGRGVLGVENQTGAKRWNLGNVKAVSNAIDRYVPEGGLIFCSWPGFIIESKNPVMLPGTENHFSYSAASALKNKEKIKRYKLFSQAVLPELTRKKEVKLYLFRHSRQNKVILKALEDAGYEEKSEDFIYVLKDN